MDSREMLFDHDVFISYTHIDDQPLGEDRRGWIAMLETALATRLGQLLGENARIWRDKKKLDGNDRFDQEIVEHLVRAAVLVSVLSPRYLKSEWCQREFATFVEAAERDHSLLIDNKSRIFKVLKTPVEREREPAQAQGLLGYCFYREELETGRIREFNRAFGKDLEQDFWRVLDDLAQDIKKLLEMLRTGKPVEPTGATLYLAETTSDLEDDRNQIRRELEDSGHRVLPDRPLPHAGETLERVIEGYLDRSRLSIHPVGAYYGLVPEARGQSLIEIQNAIAARYSQAGRLGRVIWIPVGLEVRDERQKRLLDVLKNDPDLSACDSVLETPLHELKTVIRDKLAPQKEEPTAPSQLERIYFVYDQRDEEAIIPIDDYLYDLGFEVKHPLFHGDETAIRADHQAKLRVADGVLLYYGAGDESWLNRMLLDLAEQPARGRTSAVYVAAPETREKTRYRTREVDEVVKAFAGFQPERLKGFLDRLGGRRGGTNA